MLKKIQSEIRNDVTENSYRRIVPILYFGVIAVIAWMVLWNGTRKSEDAVSYGLEGFQGIDHDWVDQDGVTFDFDEIDKYIEEEQEYVTAYYHLPEDMSSDMTIVFWSKNTYVTAMIEGEVVYQTGDLTTYLKNRTPGTRWNLVKVTDENQGNDVELRIWTAYSNETSKVDYFYLGDRAAILLYLIESKIPALFLGYLIMFFGLVYLVLNFILNANQKVKDYGLLYLAIFAMVTSIWCLLETNVVQLFTYNLELIQGIDHMMLAIGGIPLFLYLDSIYGIFQYHFIRLICGVNLAYVILINVFQFTGIIEYNQILNCSRITYLVIIATFGTCIMKKGPEYKKTRKKYWYCIIQKIGIAILGIAVTSDMICYLNMDVMDHAHYTRIGLLIFTLCFGTENIYRLSQLVRQGVQTEIISKLAYSDGLTEVGNRTAYMEKLDEILHKPDNKQLGVILFDINNLKQVNDTFGHCCGDELIRVCVAIIKETFGQWGEIYRIGGDEFAVLLLTKEPEQEYMESLSKFQQEIWNCNKGERYPFAVSIAQGVAYCNRISQGNIQETINLADQRMYRNKRITKKLGM